MKDKKEKIKELTMNCNICKKELDVYLRKLDAKAEDKKGQIKEDLGQFDEDEGD